MDGLDNGLVFADDYENEDFRFIPAQNCCDREGTWDCCSQPDIVIESMQCGYCDTPMQKTKGYHVCPNCHQVLNERDIIKGVTK